MRQYKCTYGDADFSYATDFYSKFNAHEGSMELIAEEAAQEDFDNDYIDGGTLQSWPRMYNIFTLDGQLLGSRKVTMTLEPKFYVERKKENERAT